MKAKTTSGPKKQFITFTQSSSEFILAFQKKNANVNASQIVNMCISSKKKEQDRTHKLEAFPVKSPQIAFCQTCDHDMPHKVLLAYSTDGSCEELPWFGEKIEFIECGKCKNTAFRKVYTDADMYDAFKDSHYSIISIYSTPDSGQPKIKSEKQISFQNEDLTQLYNEVVDCFNRENFILCAVGIRALIEGICNENGFESVKIRRRDKSTGRVKIAKSSELFDKIDALERKGIITKSQREILHQCRFFGNNAVHKLDSLGGKDLIGIFHLVQSIAYQIYKTKADSDALVWKGIQKIFQTHKTSKDLRARCKNKQWIVSIKNGDKRLAVCSSKAEAISLIHKIGDKYKPLSAEVLPKKLGAKTLTYTF